MTDYGLDGQGSNPGGNEISRELDISDMCSLTTEIHSEKCVVRRFGRCANVIQCTYTKLDSAAYYRYASLNDGDTF